ncbi:MAG TPA: CHAT domain-containing protein [Blastocatellia bacterium]|nr:CHAT domain-containing protein [Blastocatellia bacterium]
MYASPNQGTPLAQDPKQAAERLFQEAEQLYSQGTAESRREAINKYEEARQLFIRAQDQAGEGKALLQIGLVSIRLGENEKALTYLEQALKIFQAIGDRPAQAAALGFIANGYYNLYGAHKALPFYEQALALNRELNNPLAVAIQVGNLGFVHHSLGQMQKALEYHREALAYYEQSGDRRGQARALDNIGVVQADMGEPEAALDLHGRALAIWRELKDDRGLAISVANMASIYYDLGEWQKALEYLNEAALISRSRGERLEEAQFLTNLASVYDILGETQKALDAAGQALQMRREMKDRIGQIHTLNNLGTIYLNQGDAQKALQYHNEALALALEAGDKSWEAYTLTKIGKAYGTLGDARKALEYHDRALPQLRALNDRRSEAIALQNIGLAYERMGAAQKALATYHQALPLSRAVGYRPGEAETLFGLARVERTLGDFAQARAHIEAALEIIESLRKGVAAQEYRASFFAARRGYSEFYVDLLMEMHRRNPAQGFDAEALRAGERARARNLLDILSEARADIRQGVDPKLLERERALQSRLNAREAYRVRLLGEKQTGEQLAAVEKELSDLLSQYQEVRAHIRAASPRYAALTQPAPLGIKEIQQLLDADTLLLEYWLGEERSFLFAVTPNAVTTHALPGRTQIENAARQVYERLTARNQPAFDELPGRVANGMSRALPAQSGEETPEQRQARIARADAEYPEAARRLSQLLLAPVAAQLGAKRLLIVADGALQYIPFATLPAPQMSVVRGPSSVASVAASDNEKRTTDNGQPLIVTREIISLPSASALALLRHETASSKASRTLAVLADPVFSSSDPRLRPASGKGPVAPPCEAMPVMEVERAAREAGISAFRRLRFSRQEADAIAALAPEAQSLKAVDFTASRATVESADLSQYRILHFATHGLLNSRHPELSGIVLSLVDERGRPQDGFLRLHEIYNLKLNADLVVLSACQTALGKEVRGEGLVGLTRGFMYAGAPRVVASLWSVNDRATAELMKRFYKGMLAEGLRPAAALRAAQVEMWKQKGWESPYYWAAFALQGEWR